MLFSKQESKLSQVERNIKCRPKNTVGNLSAARFHTKRSLARSRWPGLNLKDIVRGRKMNWLPEWGNSQVSTTQVSSSERLLLSLKADVLRILRGTETQGLRAILASALFSAANRSRPTWKPEGRRARERNSWCCGVEQEKDGDKPDHMKATWFTY